MPIQIRMIQYIIIRILQIIEPKKHIVSTRSKVTALLAYLAKAVSSHSDLESMGSIPAIADARNVSMLLCQKRFNEASLPEVMIITKHWQ